MECKFSGRKADFRDEVKLRNHSIHEVTSSKYEETIIQNKEDINQRFQVGRMK